MTQPNETATDTAPAATGAEGEPAAPAAPEKGVGTPEWEKKVDALFEGDPGDETPPVPPPVEDEVEVEEGDDGQEADADEGAEGDPEPQDEGGDDAPLVLRLPGRRPKDKELELPLDAAALEKAGVTPTQAKERLAQLQNGYVRGEEIRAQREELTAKELEVQADLDELAEIETRLREKPVEYLVGNVDPKLHATVAKELLIRLADEDFDALLDDVATWERDPSARREARTTAKERELADRDARRLANDKKSTTTATVKDISSALVGMIPETMPAEKADEFFDFALYKLETWARNNPGRKLQGSEVPALLAELGALEPFGLNKKGRKAAPSTDGKDPASTTRQTRPVDEEAAAQAGKAKQDLKARVDKRRSAAVTPSGVGSAATADAKPPRGQTFEERIAWVGKKLGIS